MMGSEFVAQSSFDKIKEAEFKAETDKNKAKAEANDIIKQGKSKSNEIYNSIVDDALKKRDDLIYRSSQSAKQYVDEQREKSKKIAAQTIKSAKVNVDKAVDAVIEILSGNK